MCVPYMNVLEWLFEHFRVSLSDVQCYTSSIVVQLIRLSLRHCRLGEKRYRPLIPCSRGRLLCSTKHRTEILFAYYIRLLQHVKGMGPLLYYNGPFCEQKSKRGINCLSLRGLQLTEWHWGCHHPSFDQPIVTTGKKKTITTVSSPLYYCTSH